MGVALLTLLPMLPDLITGVEKLFSLIPKSGNNKLNAVTKTINTLFTELENSGIIPKGTPAPSSDSVGGAIEAALAALKNNGTISGTGSKAAVTPKYTLNAILS